MKNLHLVTSWLPTLEKEIYETSKHINFRIFLTSETHEGFPPGLLEGCLKVAN